MTCFHEYVTFEMGLERGICQVGVTGRKGRKGHFRQLHGQRPELAGAWCAQVTAQRTAVTTPLRPGLGRAARRAGARGRSGGPLRNFTPGSHWIGFVFYSTVSVGSVSASKASPEWQENGDLVQTHESLYRFP